MAFTFEAEVCIFCTVQLTVMCMDIESNNMGSVTSGENVVEDFL